MSNISEIYNKAYAVIGALTPISADCGKLCGARCCSGDGQTGMILFPGEERRVTASGFQVTRQSMRGREIYFAVCSGSCKRHLRPLSCRIFPLAPYYDGKNLEIIPDPRAKLLCPLLLPEASQYIQKPFRSAVLKAFEILLEDKQIADMLIDYSIMLDEYRKFTDFK